MMIIGKVVMDTVLFLVMVHATHDIVKKNKIPWFAIAFFLYTIALRVS